MLPVSAPAVSVVPPPTLIWLASDKPLALFRFRAPPMFHAPPAVIPFSARRSMLPLNVCAPTVNVLFVTVPPVTSRYKPPVTLLSGSVRLAFG